MAQGHEVWKEDEHARQYVASGRRGAMPFAKEQVATMLTFVAKTCARVSRVLDVGCGGGTIGIPFLRAYPEAEVVFHDFSDTMLAAARENAGERENASFVSSDMSAPGWTKPLAAFAPFDVIVSGYAIHHLSDERKRAVYNDIFSLLAKGGVFLNLERVASPTDEIARVHDEIVIDALYVFERVKDASRTRDAVAAAHRERQSHGGNILSPLDAQLTWLREAGFADVDCYWKYFELALFGGRRP